MLVLFLSFFFLLDLLSEDKDQSTDKEDGQSWPKGAGNTNYLFFNTSN